MDFQRCCDTSKFINYNISHEHHPMKWDVEVNEILQILLWYMPGVDSKQSHRSELIENKIYNNIIYEFFKEKMGMDDSDFLFLYEKEIEDDLWDYYRNSICINCQKAIIVAYKKHSKIKNLLRCIRNAVAHGEFMIVGDTFIGFNEKNKKKKAVIKIKYKKIIELIKIFDLDFSSEQDKANFIAYSLQKIGYEVRMEFANRFFDSKIKRFDIIATKGINKYVIEIKTTRKFYHLKPNDLEPYLKSFDELIINNDISNTKFVFIFDDYKLTKDAKVLMEAYSKKCIILDRQSIEKLFDGIDVFNEFEN